MRFELGKLELFGLDLGSLWQRWLAGMNSLLPVSLSELFLRPAPVLQAVLANDELVFRQTSGSVLAKFGCEELALLEEGRLYERLTAGYNRKMLRLVLVLPKEQVVRRTLSVPLAARNNLRQALSFQISRLTPFTQDQVVYDVAVLEERPVAGMLDVELLVANKQFVQRWQTQIERLTGLKVAKIQAPGSEANLLGKLGVPSAWWRRLNINSFLLGVLVLCVAAACVTPVLQLRMEVVRGKQEIAALDARLAEARSGWYGLQDAVERLTHVLKEQEVYAQPSVVLQELTRVMPDTVYLTNMNLTGERLDITGSGRNVVELIELINASPLFYNARFSSAVTRGRDDLETFVVTVQVRSAGEQP